MNEVNFYNSIEDHLLKFAVIITQANGKWQMGIMSAQGKNHI